MDTELSVLLEKHHLSQFLPIIQRYKQAAVGFALSPPEPGRLPGQSKFGGAPDLPNASLWPLDSRGQPLDFIIQVNFAEVNDICQLPLLPKSGLGCFFYDTIDQPWGYNPARQDGFRVLYFEEGVPVSSTAIPHPERALPESSLLFQPIVTYPYPGSFAFEDLSREAGLTDDEWNRYWKFNSDSRLRFYPGGDGTIHHLMGHSVNIQGDMQLTAELVTHGLYCGDSSGYRDPLRQELEQTCREWQLLLQLDSDERAGLYWGDFGRIYFWLRREDFEDYDFTKVWMDLQCG